MIDKNNPYSMMQRAKYDESARNWNLTDKDHVIGNFKEHLAYDDFVDLFGDMDLTTKDVLDFGCGPGRNLVRFGRKVRSIDGVDISPICLDKAQLYLADEGYKVEKFRLYETNGIDLSNIPDASYDVVMSVITLQHICVHAIRYNLIQEIYRVLRPDGIFTAQMGYGRRESGHDYYENFYEADNTNGWHDVMVSNPDQLQNDLEQIGFHDFVCHLMPCRGGDAHDQWIYFRASK
jgi:SAM-dependent methyltransferase